MSKCEVCNHEMGNVPMCFGAPSPAHLMVPKEEYDKRVIENADQCIVDGKYFFIRGSIEIPVIDSETPFAWSVWVSLSEQSFDHACERWESYGRENDEPYFGWLMTSLPCYPETQHLKTSVQSMSVGNVPQITVELTDHPLSIEQSEGITMERVHEIVHQVLN